MALTNKPKSSKYQVGDTVYFLNGVKGASAEIIKTETIVSNPASNSTGVQENLYYLNGFTRKFTEGELFHSINALMFEIKGDYLNSIFSINLEAGNNDLGVVDFSYMNFSGSSFQACYLTNSEFENANFSNVYFNGSNLSGSNMKKTLLIGAFLNSANMGDTNLTDANLLNTDCRGTNLSHAILPSNANTKSTFKSKVGVGNWDPVTTIWVDGNPIG